MSNVIDLRSRVEPKLIRGAWTDEEFRTRLLENPTAAYSSVMQEAGGELPTGTEVKALAEEPKKLYLVIPAGDVPDDLEVEVDERSSRGEFEASIILRAKRDE
ncbi:MAG: hypothetical protein MI919_38350, partial [Holophagales bacterium]|nr:hypothetical protein [Holophagales bacterium]